jgi:DNA-binding transcriptional MerR regulator
LNINYPVEYIATTKMEDLRNLPSNQLPVPTNRAAGLLVEEELSEIERQWPDGLTSRQIVDVFTARGFRFSEATLRKYVQLGLLPRSVRVGRKGKHRGSCGIYPADVVRRVNQVRAMMAADLTIEDIQRSFARFKEEIEQVEKSVRDLIAGFEREAKGPRLDPDRRAAIEAEIVAAKQAAGELVRRITGVEASLSARADKSAAGTAVGGGSDLF